MTTEEVFATVAKRQLQGIMLHEQMANYYDFLNLHGYKRCQEYHFLQETCGYRKLQRYYINHYYKLINTTDVEKKHLIPTSWYKASRSDVDSATVQQAVKEGITFSLEWEQATKKIYETAWKDLMANEDVAGALFIKEYICDVDKQIKYLQRAAMQLKVVGYDLVTITCEQDELHDKYKKKMEKVILN